MNSRRHDWDVVVTNGATRVAYNIVRSLARHGLRVGLGVDANSGMAAYSRYCAGRFRHPFSADDPVGFMKSVHAAVQAHGPAVYMPADEDVFVAARHTQELSALNVRTALAPAKTLQQLDDKFASIQLANSLNIPTPDTIRPQNSAEVEDFARGHPGPLMLKTLRSSGAEGVFQLEPTSLQTDLARAMRESGRGYGEFVVQEYVSAAGYGVSMLFDHGVVKASFAHRRLRERQLSGGPSTLRESIRHPVLEGFAERLLRAVDYHGVAMVEFKHDEVTGKTWFLEVNPRWWGSLALAIRSGVDFPVLFYRLAMGENLPPPPDYQTGVTVRWLLGDLLAYKNHIVSQRRLPGYKHLVVKVDGYDDAYADDPVPLAAELALRVMKSMRLNRRGRNKPPR